MKLAWRYKKNKPHLLYFKGQITWTQLPGLVCRARLNGMLPRQLLQQLSKGPSITAVWPKRLRVTKTKRRMPKKKGDWQKDPLREVLRQDILDGRIKAEMSTDEAAQVREEWKQMHKEKKFTARLAGMQKTLSKPPKPPAWNKKNPVWRLMWKDCVDDILPDGMTPKELKHAWEEGRNEYQAMKYSLFKSRFNSMHEQVMEAKDRAATDAFDLFLNQQKRPLPTHNHRGEPEWVDHEAKLLLEIDMDLGEHLKMTKQELWLSRLQYQDFLLSTFRGHVYQEEHTRKWAAQWTDKKKEYALVDDPNEDTPNALSDNVNQ